MQHLHVRLAVAILAMSAVVFVLLTIALNLAFIRVLDEPYTVRLGQVTDRVRSPEWDAAIEILPDDLAAVLIDFEARVSELALSVRRLRANRAPFVVAFFAVLAPVILGVARGIGETAPVLLVSGVTGTMNTNFRENPMMSLPLATFEFVRSPQPALIARGFATAAVLMLVVLFLFVIARILGGRQAGQLSNRQRRRATQKSLKDLERIEGLSSGSSSAPSEPDTPDPLTPAGVNP